MLQPTRDPEIGVWFGRIGLIHLFKSRFDEAVLWLERARNANLELPYLHCHLASAYALTGEIGRAAAELSEGRTLRGDGYSSISQIKAVGYFGVPTVNDLYEATFFAGLRRIEVGRMNAATRRLAAIRAADIICLSRC